MLDDLAILKAEMSTVSVFVLGSLIVGSSLVDSDSGWNPPDESLSRPSGWVLQSPHPIVARLVLHLGQTEDLQDRRHVVPETTAESLLQAVPATDGVL